MNVRQFANEMRKAASGAVGAGADQDLDLAVPLPPTSYLGWLNGMPIETEVGALLYVTPACAERLAEDLEFESGLFPVTWTDERAGRGLWAITTESIDTSRRLRDPSFSVVEALRIWREGGGPPWRA